MAAGWINIYYLYWPVSQGWKVYRTDILLGLGYSYASRLNNINYREEGNLKFVLKFLVSNKTIDLVRCAMITNPNFLISTKL